MSESKLMTHEGFRIDCDGRVTITVDPNRPVYYCPTRDGEHLFFVYDRRTREIKFRRGGVDWEAVSVISPGRLSDVLARLELPPAKEAWSKACWQLATGPV